MLSSIPITTFRESGLLAALMELAPAEANAAARGGHVPVTSDPIEVDVDDMDVDDLVRMALGADD